jgi:HD superfamily phosphohydrolase
MAPYSRSSLIAGILSSPIDVDKVAYLQDDSTMTGIRYGQGIDLDALLGSLRAPRPEEIDHRHPVIAINDKGLSAAESVAVARYWMLKRVYWHHTNRAIMAMVKFVIASLLEAGRLDMVAYLRQGLFGTETEAIGYLSGAFQRAAESGAFDTRHTHIVNTLIGLQPGYRALYKRILTIAPGTSSSDRYLYRRMEGTPYAELLDVAQEIADRLEEELRLSDRLKVGEVLVDVPYKEREGIGGKLGGQVYVYPRSRSGTVQPLEQYSPVLESLRDQFDQHIEKCRVFIHPRVHALIGPQLEAAQEVAREVLEERAGGGRRGGLG